jgi:hypothetical protein
MGRDNEWRYTENVYDAHGEVHLTEPHFIMDQCDCKSEEPDGYSRVQSQIDPSKPNGHYMYHQVYHSTVLRSAHTVCLCVFVDLRTNSGYFLIQH